VNTGSSGNITLHVTCPEGSIYQISAKLIHKATGADLAGITASTATEVGSSADVALSCGESGWPEGEYTVQLVVSSINDGMILSNTIQTNTTIRVGSVCTVTFKSEGNADIVKTVSSGGTLTDIPAVPEKAGYTGAWDTTDFSNITANKVVTAVYTLVKVGTISTGSNSVTGVDGTTFDPNTILTVEDVTSHVSPSQMNQYNAGVRLVAGNHDLVQLYDVKLLLGSAPYPLNGGKVRVRIKLSDELAKYSDLQVVYIDDGGNVSKIQSTVEDGYIVFETTHFSNYGIIGVPASANPTTGDTSTSLPALFILGGSAVAAAVLVLYKKKSAKI
jgi:LPXTG-motif cell wall-anchored protein